MCVYGGLGLWCGRFSGHRGGAGTTGQRSMRGICGLISREMQNQGLMPFSTSRGALEQVPSRATRAGTSK